MSVFTRGFFLCLFWAALASHRASYKLPWVPCMKLPHLINGLVRRPATLLYSSCCGMSNRQFSLVAWFAGQRLGLQACP
jgi:hypothetical protein